MKLNRENCYATSPWTWDKIRKNSCVAAPFRQNANRRIHFSLSRMRFPFPSRQNAEFSFSVKRKIFLFGTFGQNGEFPFSAETENSPCQRNGEFLNFPSQQNVTFSFSPKKFTNEIGICGRRTTLAAASALAPIWDRAPCSAMSHYLQNQKGGYYA